MTENAFSRFELHKIFALFKTLCKVAAVKGGGSKVQGIDLDTFRTGIAQLSVENDELVEKIFESSNTSLTTFLSWSEFLKAMKILCSTSLLDKISLFFEIIDSDGNGLLSVDEVEEICKMSLTRFSDPGVEEFISEMAVYLKTWIFEAMSTDEDDEIPMDRIKEEIFKKGPEALD